MTYTCADVELLLKTVPLNWLLQAAALAAEETTAKVCPVLFLRANTHAGPPPLSVVYPLNVIVELAVIVFAGMDIEVLVAPGVGEPDTFVTYVYLGAVADPELGVVVAITFPVASTAINAPAAVPRRGRYRLPRVPPAVLAPITMSPPTEKLE